MEIPLGKVLTTPPIANLGHGMVTCRVKRRKLGDRVIRQFSPEITVVWCADVVYCAEGNTCVIERVRFHTAPRGWKSAMSHNDAVSTGESLRLPYQASVEPVMHKWYTRQLTKEGKRAAGSRMAA